MCGDGERSELTAEPGRACARGLGFRRSPVEFRGKAGALPGVKDRGVPGVNAVIVLG